MITQWFNPEPMLKGMMFLEKLRDLGHEVQVLTGFPNYPGGNIYPGYRQGLRRLEMTNGISVVRVPLYPSHDANGIRRSLNYISFALSASTIGLLSTNSPDVIYVYHPPATVALPAILGKLFRRTPVIYEVQDLWPDTLSATGMIHNKVLLKIVGYWCRLTYRLASKIIVLSPGFKEILVSRGVPGEKIEVIYNWSDEEDKIINALPNRELSEELKFDGKFSILYSGAMGKAQGLEAVLAAAEIVKSKYRDIQFIFMGDGIELTHLKGIARNKLLDNVVFHPRRPVDKIGEILKLADALLVHLKDDPLFRITIPSKIQAYLAAGRPILAAVAGDAAELVHKAKAGIICTPGSPESIADAAVKMYMMPEKVRREMEENGKSYYLKELSLRVGVDRYSDIFNKVLQITNG